MSLIHFLSFEFSWIDLALIASVALMIGMAKTGVHGAGMAAVPLLAIVFGGKLSSGIMLPILSIADVFAVIYYHRHTEWKHLLRLFPWAALGVILGTLTGEVINDQVFRLIMGIIILLSLAIMVWREKSNNQNIPKGLWFAALLGVLGGFTTMVGNLAGSVMALYLLTMRMPKNQFIGTAAWFFMIVNWFKVPFHVFVWKTITWETFLLDLSLTPIIAIGAFIGVFIIKRIPEKSYRWFIIIMTAVAGLFMVF